MEKNMSILAKLTLTSVTKSNKADPIVSRRERLIDKLKEQIKVFEEMKQGSVYCRTKEVSRFDEDGNKITSVIEQKVKPFFFEQDNGWYVQCRYGSRVMNIYNKHNAVFVNNFNDIEQILNKFIEATKQGEFDKIIASLLMKRK